MHLTKRLIDTFTFAERLPKRDIRWDDALPGFGVRVYPSGRKTFVMSYRHLGRKRLMALGAYGVLTLDQARTRARVKLGEVLQGRDPLGEAQQAAKGGTLADLVQDFL